LKLLESNFIKHISKVSISLNLKLRFTCEETNSVCFLNNAMQSRGSAAPCQYLRRLHINGLVEFDELVVLFCNTFARILYLSNSIRQICYYVAFNEEEASVYIGWGREACVSASLWCTLWTHSCSQINYLRQFVIKVWFE
jgi:hypothetical protein